MVLLALEAIKGKHFIESHVVSWASIEQILLPKLIGFVSKQLKLELPKNIYKLGTQNINYIYLCISHDKSLYSSLEKGRILRNRIIHKLYKEKDLSAIKKLARESTTFNIDLQQEILGRLTGDVLIPSLNLYRDGWNDARKKIVVELEKLKTKPRKE